MSRPSEPDPLREFRSKNSRLGRHQCSVRSAIDSLPPDAAARLEAALAAPWRGVDRIEHAAIERWLLEQHIDVRALTIGHHRNGTCACRHAA